MSLSPELQKHVLLINHLLFKKLGSIYYW